ncbi:hypothetical protein KIK84_16230 [Curvibacter sp. CHRR-16]|uniref:hypothetical protein n=1 Tax=Curvibacter sp. CHRR-16 TaxID=2835872 RepID=UPI001BDA9BA3|nr:hypothetical protein [Curvibacter sp. CHRR-16]MBT0571864.1 hypothetical protein [Curvibacter sp. CHRR-16]
MTLAGAVLLLGLGVIALAQLAIALHAFTSNPLKGILCFVLPMYVWVYARKGNVSPWYMRAWYAGVLLLVVGAVLAS